MRYKSRINGRFLKAYRALPQDVRDQARKAYRQFKQNPEHPSLRFKQINRQKSIYSARVSLSYRTLGVVEGDVIIFGSAVTPIMTS